MAERGSSRRPAIAETLDFLRRPPGEAEPELEEQPAALAFLLDARSTDPTRSSLYSLRILALRRGEGGSAATDRLDPTPHAPSYADGSKPEPDRFLPGKDKDGKDSTEPNPLHPIWVREDQQVLGYLLNNLSKEVLVQVTAITTTHALWTMLEAMFSS